MTHSSVLETSFHKIVVSYINEKNNKSYYWLGVVNLECDNRSNIIRETITDYHY